jgi:hypothetical protein
MADPGGVIQPNRIRQVHLDFVMMGLISVAVGLAVPDLPDLAIALVWAAIVGPG